MRVTYRDGIWIAESSFAEKDAVKQAGFWWHPGVGQCRFKECAACAAGLVKQWWTFKSEAAVKLIDYCDDAAKQALTGHIAAVKESKASDADLDIPCPDGLAYMPFQRAGISYALSRRGTLIADEMGLGKTIQALGVANAKGSRTILVVVPASLRHNWAREARKWLANSSLTMAVVDSPDTDISHADIVIINFERIKGKHFEVLMARTWDLLIVDEAHKIKNPEALRTKRVLGSYNRRTKVRTPGLVDRAQDKLFLTGTPILNRPVELHPLVAALNPRMFGNFWMFVQRYCDAHRTRYGWDFTGASNLGELQDRLRANLMVRRLKADVLTDLPPKTRTIIELHPNGAKEALDAERKAWEQMGFDPEVFEDLQADVELARAAGDDSAYQAAVARLDSAIKIAFEDMSQHRHNLAVQKIPAVLEHCDTLLEGGLDKLVIFAHHHDVIDKLAEHYADSSVVLDGRTPNEQRQASVDRFQTDPTAKVFIGGIHAAGVGLTLTAASHVVFAELDWVPANILQAEDRCHRIGQTDNVTVQHLVLDGSLDARLAHVLVWKQGIIERALDKDAPKIQVPEVKDIKPKYPKATPEQRDACTQAVRLLAGMCDGALTEDGRGFNKMDSRIGKQLAQRSFERPLTDGEVHLCKRILPKYHRQIGAGTVQQIKGAA